MLWNIIDSRKQPYRWKHVVAVVEATSNDNSTRDADQVDAHDDDILYDQRVGLSVAEAVQWAMSHPQPVTLFLYDAGTVL